LVKTDAAVVALTVTVVETLTSVVAVAMVDGGRQTVMAMATAAKTVLAVAAAATVAMVLADNNRNCRGRQQSTKCGSSSSRDSGHGSGNRGSTAAMVGRGSGTAEGTTMRAAATVTTVVMNLYPPFPLAMAREGAAKLKERDGMEEEHDYVEAFHVCDYFTLASESRSTMCQGGSPRLNFGDSQTLISDRLSSLVRFKCICDGFSKI
jgi:hypothetical protein